MRLHVSPYLWDPFGNPLEALQDAIVGAYKELSKTVQGFIIDPGASLVTNETVKLFQYSQDNLAGYLTYVGLGLAIIFGVFFMKGKPMVEAFVAWIVVSALAPIWTDIVVSMRDGGRNAAEVITFFDAPNVGSTIELFDNPILAIFLAGPACGAVMAVGGVILSYEVVTVGFQTFMLVAIALYAFGSGPKKFARIVLAFGLLATLFGPPSLTFFIEAGLWAIDVLPQGKTSVGAAIYVIISYGLALLFQGVLLYVLYKGVTAIEGRILAIAKGTLAVFSRKVLQVETRRYRQERMNQPMPVRIAREETSRSDETKRQIKQFKMTAAAGAATAAGHPEIGLALGAVSKNINKPRE